jgi:hypothetical protein
MSPATQVAVELNAAAQKQVLDFISQLPVSPPQARVGLYGLFHGLDTIEAEIAEARREMWGQFPREGF